MAKNSGTSRRSGRTAQHQLTSLELFAGAGGLALGVHQAGFAHLGLVENNSFAVETLRENSQRVLQLDPELVLHIDARDVKYKSFAGEVDLLSGGPPCQPFSTAGLNLGHTDERNMFPVFLEALATIMPKAVMVENVKGLLRPIFRDYFNYILKRIQFPLYAIKRGEDWKDHYKRIETVNESDFTDSEQYVVRFQLVDVADYGIPQRRERVLITAFRRDLGIDTFQVEPTHSKEALLKDQWIARTYWERHNIPPCDDHLGKFDRILLEQLEKEQVSTSVSLPWKTVRDVLRDLPPPVPRGHKEVIANHIQHPGARIYPGHVGSFWDYPAKALKAGTHGTPGGENLLRVTSDGEVRYFTTREAARLHTFPESWHFHGTWGACIKQLGNAVPVELSRIFATEIYNRLTRLAA